MKYDPLVKLIKSQTYPSNKVVGIPARFYPYNQKSSASI